MKVLIYILSLLIFWVAGAELFTRYVVLSPDKYYPFEPFQYSKFFPPKKIMPDARDSSVFSINSLGIRGDEISYRDTMRILAIGGSTTINMNVDDEAAWPKALQDMLNKQPACSRTWVGNAGKAGMQAYNHILTLKHFTSQVPDLRIALVLVGSNDLSNALGLGHEAWSNERRLHHTFAYVPVSNSVPFPRNTALYTFGQHLITMYRSFQTGVVQDQHFKWVLKARERRQQARPHLNTLPNISPKLKKFESELSEIVSTAKAQNIVPIFITQPLMFHAGMTADEKSSLGIFGGVGTYAERMNSPHPKFYSPEAVDRLMTLFNEITLKVCKRHKLTCIDLAKKMPKTLAHFYDGIHYTEQGNHFIARTIAGKICPQMYR